MKETSSASSTSTDSESTDFEASKKKKKPWKRNEPLVNTLVISFLLLNK